VRRLAHGEDTYKARTIARRLYRPIDIVSERWYSTELQMSIKTVECDPRHGEITYQVFIREFRMRRCPGIRRALTQG
jgi:hypothetical protein